MKPNPLFMTHKDFRARLEEINAEHEKLKQEFAGNPEKLAEVDKQMASELQKAVSTWERSQAIGMLEEARKLNIDLPSAKDQEAWVGLNGDFGLPFLSNKGKLMMRRLIDEEKTRRREVGAWWWKTVIIPVLTSLTGVIGALTGLIAVLHRK